MDDDGLDPLVAELGQLSAVPPRSLLDLVFAQWSLVSAPVGDVYVAYTDAGIDYVRLATPEFGETAFLDSYRDRFGRPLRPAARPPAGVLPALQGRVAANLRFNLSGLSEFERAVLDVTRRIPAGQTRPYSWVADQIGRPKAVRAVGTALGNNPVPLLIPCHRVTRMTGDPGDYVFGPRVKERLLRAENVNLDEVAELASRHVYFIGSATTHIVCFPTCACARRITERHRRGFRTVAEASQHGYRPCKRCRPVMAPSA
jgi:methylated-DNA-[protein]-cysteine S-methyltransferase